VTLALPSRLPLRHPRVRYAQGSRLNTTYYKGTLAPLRSGKHPSVYPSKHPCICNMRNLTHRGASLRRAPYASQVPRRTLAISRLPHFNSILLADLVRTHRRFANFERCQNSPNHQQHRSALSRAVGVTSFRNCERHPLHSAYTKTCLYPAR
jgi:hypothetical protein